MKGDRMTNSSIGRLLTHALLVGTLAIFITSCSGPSDKVPTRDSEASEETTTKMVEIDTPEAALPGMAQLAPNQVYSPLNGLPMAKEAILQRPIAVMFDNQISARPQAGLNQADIVYEAFVEGQITRYMGVFQSSLPTDIGPVRSARPYFVALALENDSYYAHIGGSVEAKEDIKRLKVADIEGLVTKDGIYWRKSHKKKPHNMYASSTSLLEWAQVKKYRDTSEFEPLSFGVTSGLDAAASHPIVKVIYKQGTQKDSVGYFIEFVYNVETARYDRLVNGKPHTDEVTKEQLVAQSVIVQLAKTRVIDQEGRLSMAVVGKGTGYYFCAGKVMPITWEKATEASRTHYFDSLGQPLVLNPGKLWIQLVPMDYKLN